MKVIKVEFHESGMYTMQYVEVEKVNEQSVWYKVPVYNSPYLKKLKRVFRVGKNKAYCLTWEEAIHFVDNAYWTRINRMKQRIEALKAELHVFEQEYDNFCERDFDEATYFSN